MQSPALAARRVLARPLGAFHRPALSEGLGRLRARLATAPYACACLFLRPAEELLAARPDYPAGFADLARGSRDRLTRLRGRQRLILIGICGLVVAAVLVGVLAPVGSGANAGAQSWYGMAGFDGEPGGGLDNSLDRWGVSGLSTYAPEVAIVNTLPDPAETPRPAIGFTWYTVANGDSLRSIAAAHGITIDTLYMANRRALPDPDRIKAGLRLLIPPTDGKVIKVKEGDTLDSLAGKYHLTVAELVDGNQLLDANLVAGQYLVLPGIDSGGVPGRVPGGRMWWPVAGTKNYISQYYWSGHHAIDIAAAYRTPVIAAASGTVVFAGWRSYQQGGYVVWIMHSDTLYTTYNHLTSKRYVRVGQTVRAGQQVGQIGLSGNTTGPHLHFEVWLAYPWADGTNAMAVNPCYYLSQC